MDKKKASTTAKEHIEDRQHKSKEACRKQPTSNKGNQAKLRQQGGENIRASKKSETVHISLLNGNREDLRSLCGLVEADLEDVSTGGVSQVERVGCGVMKIK